VKTPAALLLTLLLSACATGYQSKGFGGGFSETRMDKNIWVVRFEGNRYTSDERATDFVLLRCAELALENGYPYFAIVGSADQSSFRAFTEVHGSGPYAWASSNIIKSPGRANTIIGLREKPENAPVYDAAFLRAELRKKYELDEAAK
jgi:hypothetical protein